jgi:hypothetical protein
MLELRAQSVILRALSAMLVLSWRNCYCCAGVYKQLAVLSLTP